MELTFVFLIVICNTAILFLTYIDSKKTSEEHKEYLERTDKRHEELMRSFKEDREHADKRFEVLIQSLNESADKRLEVLINSLEERTDKLITEMRKDRKRRYR